MAVMDVIVVGCGQARELKTYLKERSFYEKKWLAKNLSDKNIALPVNKKFIDACQKGDIITDVRLCHIPFSISKEELKANSKNQRNNPVSILKHKLQNCNLWHEELYEDFPKSFEKFGDMLLLNNDSFKMDIWEHEGLWDLVASSFACKRIARKSAISGDGFRSPRVSMVLGSSGCVEHIDNGIKYQYDIKKCMFSPGNITEKLRISRFDCSDETVVDLYAGIGYFTLPYLVHAKAKKVIACEWNPSAVEALKNNLTLNKVSERCTVLEGDNRQTCPRDVADRINLGLIPSSEDGWETGCLALNKNFGGTMHVHGNVVSEKSTISVESEANNQRCDKEFNPTAGVTQVANMTRTTKTQNSESSGRRFDKKSCKKEWNEWAADVAERLKVILNRVDGQGWSTTAVHVEHVKSYAPHVDHIVADVECRPPGHRSRINQ